MPLLDRRTDILAQVETLLNGLTITLSDGTIPAANFVHNRNELPAALVPGIILLDADEVSDPRGIQAPPGRGGPPGAKLMRMTPEIYVVLDVRKPNNVNVGEDLNKARLAILGTILNDKTLQQIVGANGQISYDGCVTDLARNRTMQGQLGISVTFVYPLVPGELV
jgi:hypothetical protein